MLQQLVAMGLVRSRTNCAQDMESADAVGTSDVESQSGERDEDPHPPAENPQQQQPLNADEAHAAAPTPVHSLYDFDAVLSAGVFSSVWKAVDVRTAHPVAIKAVSRLPLHRTQPLPESEPQPLSEAEITGGLVHRNIVRLLGTPDIPGYPEALVIEYCRGGDLFDRVIRDDFEIENHGKEYVVQLADAVAFIHTEGFVHNDIKLENVVVMDDMATVKLCDFGLAGRAGDVRVGPAEGTKEYMAPELVLAHRGVQYTVDYASDVFSLGILMHTVIFAFL